MAQVATGAIDLVNGAERAVRGRPVQRLARERLEQHENVKTGFSVRMTGPLVAAVPYGETSYRRRIFSIVFPFASSSISLSR